MVTCSCGKVMDKVPDWLSVVTVEFVCNNCPNRKVKNIASVTLEPDLAHTAKIDAAKHTDEDEEDMDGLDEDAE